VSENTFTERVVEAIKRIPTGMVAGKITALKAYLVFLTIALISCNRLSPFQRVGIVKLPLFMPDLVAEIYYVDHPLSEEEIKEWSIRRAEEVLEKNGRLSAVSILVLYDRKAAEYFLRPKNFYALTEVGDVAPILFTDTVYIKRKTEGGACLVLFNDNDIRWSFMQRKEINNPEEVVQ